MELARSASPDRVQRVSEVGAAGETVALPPMTDDEMPLPGRVAMHRSFPSSTCVPTSQPDQET
jgi:hypothetical protein